MRESHVEKKVCDFARARGCMVMKLAGPNQKGQPDRMFIKDGKVLFIEFKAPGKHPTGMQSWWLERLSDHEIPATCCDNTDDGKCFVDQIFFK